MQYIISGKNIDVTEGLKSAIHDKIGKLERYFTPETEVHVTLSVEKERQKIEITIPMKGNIVRAEQVSNDMYVSIDLVEEIIERQLRKYKNKLVEQKQAAVSLSKAFVEEEIEEDDEIKIIRSKRFAMKPMDPKKLVSKWTYLDIIFMYSVIRQRMRSMLCIREKAIHLA